MGTVWSRQVCLSSRIFNRAVGQPLDYAGFGAVWYVLGEIMLVNLPASISYVSIVHESL
jgi:hypothetical protein